MNNIKNEIVNTLINELKSIETNKKIEKKVIEDIIEELVFYCEGHYNKYELALNLDALKMKLSEKSKLHAKLEDIADIIEVRECRDYRLEKIVNKYIELLRKYCHDEGCHLIHNCPEMHFNCSKKLGLDTAIAWQTAKKLELFIHCIKNRTETVLFISDVIDILKLHYEKYCDLIVTLDNCRNAFRNWKYIEELEKLSD